MSETSMSVVNKAVVRRFYEEYLNPGNLAVADEIIAPECPLYFRSMFMGTGPEAFKQTRAMMYSGFPDLRFTMEEMIAEGDKVAERLTVRGTHEGEFMGVPATGKQVEFLGMGVFRIREGKIVEFRAMPDMLGVLQQIGAVPEPGQEEARAAEGERDERGLIDKAKEKLTGQ
jgi:steroid delta-isomerase-like uncharacterized protein